MFVISHREYLTSEFESILVNICLENQDYGQRWAHICLPINGHWRRWAPCTILRESWNTFYMFGLGGHTNSLFHCSSWEKLAKWLVTQYAIFKNSLIKINNSKNIDCNLLHRLFCCLKLYISPVQLFLRNWSGGNGSGKSTQICKPRPSPTLTLHNFSHCLSLQDTHAQQGFVLSLQCIFVLAHLMSRGLASSHSHLQWSLMTCACSCLAFVLPFPLPTAHTLSLPPPLRQPFSSV